MSTSHDAEQNGSVKKPTIAVDFDGVIYQGKWAGSAAPLDPAAIVKGTREAMEILRQKFRVIIFTCRAYSGYTSSGEWAEGHAHKVAHFLKDNGIPFDDITTFPGKISADLYIDDKALTFSGDWFATITAAEGFKVWNASR